MRKCTDSWRKPKPYQPLFGKQVSSYPATRIFDQFSFIGNPYVCCFIIETTDGLIMIDCMERKEDQKQSIVQGISDLGLDPYDLKAILITHGHGDHYGFADWFREQYGCKIYMSKETYDFATQANLTYTKPIPYEVYDFLDDYGEFKLGNQSVFTYLTPGHCPGCMSFIVPVTDEGRPHMLAIWGGTLPPFSMAWKVDYLESLRKFGDITDKMDVDCEISNHPYVDNSIERMDVLRNINDGVPNPFVIGKEAYKRYERMFLNVCLESIHKQAYEADELLPPPPKRIPPKDDK